ncbi:ABC transporter permease [Myroides odoratimimus]|uniref:ABC transporter permease n=1 Tax=Myroides odoratimimus TaxID=76832 RepID=UPI0024E02D74|nr:ABC transporter permease [Myroides odoratimimus]WHT74245.1 ABC transporter permease [Myroides odoratimimus]
MLKNWLKIYWYNTMKHKMYFLLTVVGLAIGIASVTLASLYYLEESSYDQWNPYKDEVFVLETKSDQFSIDSQPFGLGYSLKDNYPIVEDYMYYNGVYFQTNVKIDEKEYTIEKVIYAQKNFFSFFPFEFIYGNDKTAFNNPNDIAIELELAELLFGKNVNPLGEEIEIKDVKYSVSAVYRIEHDIRSSMSPNIVIDKLSTEEIASRGDWFTSNYNLVVKTKDKEQARVAIDNLFYEHFYTVLAESKGVSVEEFVETTFKSFYAKSYLLPLNGARMNAIGYFFPEGNTNLLMLKIIVGLSVMILLLSIFNFINLALSQSLNRTKEVGVRKVLGANRGLIISQGLFESFITTGIALLLSVIILELLVPFINVFVGTTIEFSFFKFIGLLSSVLIVVTLLVGMLPALYLDKMDTVSALKGFIYKSTSGRILKNSFLVLQFVIASFFITSGILIHQQVNYMLHKDLGFKGDQVIGVLFDENNQYNESSDRLSKYYNFKEELLQLKGVEDVSTASSHFGSGALSNVFTYHSYQSEQFLVEQIGMDYNYFDLYDIKMKQGRNISCRFASDSINNIIVNEAFVREMKEKEPLGKFIEGKGFKYTIIGVVDDYNNERLANEVKPKIYYHFHTNQRIRNNFLYVSIKLSKDKIEPTLEAVEKIWKKYNIDSKIPFVYEFVDQRYAKTFDRVLLERKVFRVLNYTVVFIALFGLFAVSSFTIGTKLREVAIRKVLGAETFGLLRQLTFQYIIYCLVGFGIAVFPSYYFLNKWLENYAYRIEIGWSVYVYSLLLILGLTLLIVISRAYKATRVDVLKYIKYE